MKRSLMSSLILVLTVVAGHVTALGSTFSVNPVRIDLSAKRPNAALQVTNLSDAPLTIQAHVVRWQVHEDHAFYVESDEVVLNPPIFTLDPRQKQFMRLGLRWPNEASTEMAYRLILEEVPKPPKPGFTGLRTVLRISIPIFARPQKTVSPQIVWHAEKTQRGELQVSASNLGGAHIQIKKLMVSEGKSASPAFRTSEFTYLLPQQSHVWDIDAPETRDSTAISIDALTDAGEIHEVLLPKTN